MLDTDKSYSIDWSKVVVVLRYPVHPTTAADVPVKELDMPLLSFASLLREIEYEQMKKMT